MASIWSKIIHPRLASVFEAFLDEDVYIERPDGHGVHAKLERRTTPVKVHLEFDSDRTNARLVVARGDTLAFNAYIVWARKVDDIRVGDYIVRASGQRLLVAFDNSGETADPLLELRAHERK